MRTHNLATGETLEFDEFATAEWAVAYGYCYTHNKLSALFAATNALQFWQFLLTLPLEVSKSGRTIACGDWAALRPQAKDLTPEQVATVVNWRHNAEQMLKHPERLARMEHHMLAKISQGGGHLYMNRSCTLKDARDPEDYRGLPAPRDIFPDLFATAEKEKPPEK